jgi:hypothetical protein
MSERRPAIKHGERPAGEWPAWVSDVLAYGPIAELETDWRAEIGDAITKALDLRAGTVEVYNCAKCGAARYRRAE